MGWIRKKAKQIGKGIKSAFKGLGKAFNKVAAVIQPAEPPPTIVIFFT